MTKHAGLLSGALLACVLALPVAAADDLTADTVVATVNGATITLGHMIVLRDALPEQYKSLPDDMLFKGILDQLIQQTALAQTVEQNLSKADVLSLENDRRGYLSGVVLKGVAETAVTDDAIKAAYDAKFANLPAETEYHAAHILVDSEEKANELKAQIEGGADFAEIAKANSSDTGSAVNGGDLGWFGLGMMVKPFEEAVVAAPTGTVVGPVKTDFGWHLIRVSETRQKAAPTIDEVRDQLAQEIERQSIDAKIAEATAGADVTRPGEGIDPAVLKDLTLLDK